MGNWYLWAFIIILIVYKVFAPQIKGFFGEKAVSIFLSTLDPSKYLIINDLLIPAGPKTAQIDHVVVSNYGIFVIETKNYKGWILGNEYDNYWTQVIYKRKERLYNPIKQNSGHIRALNKALKEYPNLRFISIVAFTTKCDLKVRTETDVVYTVHIASTIKGYTGLCISDEMKDQIYSKLINSNIKGWVAKKNHIESIKNPGAKKNYNYKLAVNLCPRCGGNLVRRKGRYGDFTGCDNYPRCKYTIK